MVQFLLMQQLLFLYFALFLVMLVPFVSHYLDVGSMRTLNDVTFYLQNQLSWLRNVSILDTLFLKDIPYITFYERDEITASSGIFTTILALIGVLFVGKYKATKVVLYSQLALIFFMSCTVNAFFLWQYLFNIIPGIQGIRTIIRISFIALIILAIALCALINYLQNKNKIWAKVLLILSIIVVVFEQIPCFDGLKYDDPNSQWMTYGWSKSAFEAQIKEELAKVPDDCEVLMFIPNMIKTTNISHDSDKDNEYKISASIHALGMWVALRKNVYSKNGLSGMARMTYPTPEYKEYQKVFTVSIDEFNDEKYLLGLEKI